jgi:hypothetical protein
MNKFVLFTAVALMIVIYIMIIIYGGNSINTAYTQATTEQVIKSADIPSSNSTSDCTYSMWFYIKDWNYRRTEEKKIIVRKDKGLEPFIQVALGAYDNTLDVKVKCYPPGNQVAGVIEGCKINNIPIQAWVNISISLNGRVLDIYMDGKLVRTCVLPNVPKVVAGDSDLLITPDGGFSGFTTNIQYYDGPKNPTEIYKIYRRGYTGDGFFQNMFGRYRLTVSIVDENEKVDQ